MTGGEGPEILPADEAGGACGGPEGGLVGGMPEGDSLDGVDFVGVGDFRARS